MKRTLLAFALTVACTFAVAATASAQADAVIDDTRTPSAVPDASTFDAATMDRADTRTLRRQTIHGVFSRDEQARAQSLFNILYLTQQHPEAYDFTRATTGVCRIAESDDDAALRLMAVVTLRRLDNAEAMACLAGRLDVEPDPMVVKIIRHSLVDYHNAGVRIR